MRVWTAFAAAAILVSCAGTSASSDTTLQDQEDAVAATQTPGTEATPRPTAPPTRSPSATPPDPTVDPEPTGVPDPTAIPDVTAVPDPTARPTRTPTPEATAIKTPTPSVTPDPSPGPDTEEPTVTPTAEPTATPTAEPTVTPTAEPTATPTAEPTVTPTATPEAGPNQTLEPVDYTGEVRAVRTQTGLMLAVRGDTGAEYQVVTPCYNVALTSSGLPITGAIDVLIDPGHGGEESGAVGPNGLKESTINLRVAELLRGELQELGYRVELTRYGDHYVSIPARTELANTLQPRLFVSVHHNGGYPEPIPQAATEVFVQQGNAESARLGGLIFEELQAAFADIDIDWMGNEESFGVAWRENEEGTDLYGVLRRTPDLVSVLTEAMFLSTEAEADLLAQPATAMIEAQALAIAVDRWFETSDGGSGFIEGVVFRGDLGNGGGTQGCVDPPLD